MNKNNILYLKRNLCEKGKLQKEINKNEIKIVVEQNVYIHKTIYINKKYNWFDINKYKYK